MPAAFSALRAAGIRVALTTGFDRQLTDPLLAALGWNVPDVIDAVVCADEVPTADPYHEAEFCLLRWIGDVEHQGRGD